MEEEEPISEYEEESNSWNKPNRSNYLSPIMNYENRPSWEDSVVGLTTMLDCRLLLLFLCHLKKKSW